MLTIGLLQMTPHGADQDANLAKGDDFCRRAHDLGADIALFPEMWNIGYTPYEGCGNEFHEVGAESPEQERERKRWQAQAIGRDSTFVQHFQALARELSMAIAITHLEEWPGAPRDSLSLFDRDGRFALHYAKVHTCAFGLEAACTPGGSFPVCPLDTAQGQVTVGAMICYDREFPEPARILMLAGAEIIITPNACKLEENRIGQFRARANENMVGVAMTNYAAPKDNGNSVAFDGMWATSKGTHDPKLIQAGPEEGVFLAGFDLEALRAYRDRETWGNAFRRPSTYAALAAVDVRPPFVRTDANGVPYADWTPLS